MCTPFFTADGKLLAPFSLIHGISDGHYDGRHQALVGLASQASIALHNALVYQEMQKREQIERDLELAAQVQQSILPELLRRFPAIIFTSTTPRRSSWRRLLRFHLATDATAGRHTCDVAARACRQPFW